MLADLTIKDFLAETAGSAPVPGWWKYICLEWRYSGSFDRDGGPSDCWQKEICGSGRTNENDRYRGGFDP